MLDSRSKWSGVQFPQLFMCRRAGQASNSSASSYPTVMDAYLVEQGKLNYKAVAVAKCTKGEFSPQQISMRLL